MKIFFTLGLAVLLTILNASAQIKVVRSENSAKQDVVKYDSTDISLINPEKYIGQTAIYFKRNGLFVKDYKSFGGTKVYKAPVFSYFNIIGFEPPQTFKLQRVDNGDVCYYTHFGDGTKPIILTTHFECHKNRLLNTEWAIDDRDSIWVISDVYIKEDNGIDYTATMKNDTAHITIKTLYGCRNMDYYHQLSKKYSQEEWVVDENNAYGRFEKMQVVKVKVWFIFKSSIGKHYAFNADKGGKSTYNNGLTIEMLPLFKKSEAINHIKEFGLTRWKQILNADVKLDMTEKMILLSVGSPNHRISDTSVTGTVNIWEYGYMDVYFRNGKVFSIVRH